MPTRFRLPSDAERVGSKYPPYSRCNTPNRRAARNTNSRRVDIYAHAVSGCPATPNAWATSAHPTPVATRRTTEPPATPIRVGWAFMPTRFRLPPNTKRIGSKCPPYPRCNPPNRRTARNTNLRRVGIHAHAFQAAPQHQTHGQQVPTLPPLQSAKPPHCPKHQFA